MIVNLRECEFVGLDPKRVRSIARRMAKAMADADELGLSLFGGSWNATLRAEAKGHREIIVAEMDECQTSGGCGAQCEQDGLIKGEQ